MTNIGVLLALAGVGFLPSFAHPCDQRNMEKERNEEEDVFVVDINLGPQFEEVEAQLQRISYFLESINNALLNFTDALKKHEEET